MEDSIGNKLQSIRKQKGLSIQELARRSKIAPSFISQVERGINSISVASLKRILDAMKTSLSEFFKEDAGTAPKIFYKKEEMRNIGTRNGLELFELAPDYPDRKLQVLREVYAPGSDTGPETYCHDAEESSMCVEGSVEMIVGEETFVLREGDGVYFNSNTPHRVRNPFEKRAVVISVNTPPSF